MTLSILLLLIIIVVALVLFSFEWLSPDITALGVLLALILFGLVPIEQAFAGFGSDTFMLLLGLLILTAALIQTGVVDFVGRRLLQLTNSQPKRLLLVMMLVVGIMSSLISNTAAAAFFLPVILGLSQRAKINASRLLMPMAFAAILSSSVTLVGTSTNLVVSGLIEQAGLPAIGLLELTPVGIPILIAGVLYMLLVGQKMIPVREAPKNLTDALGLRPYLAELRIAPDSPLVNQTLAESGLGRDLDLTVLDIIREKEHVFECCADETLQAGDSLLVKGSSEAILKVKDIPSIDIQADAKFSDFDLQEGGLRLAEVVLLPRSIFIGKTIKGLNLREKYHIQVLAISRRTGVVHHKIAQTRLHLGDVLLVQGDEEQISAMRNENAFDVLGVIESKRFRPQRAWLVTGIFAGVLSLAALRLVPLPVSMLLGALLVFLMRLITPEEAYQQVEWKALVLIGSMLTLGVAMQATGTAQYLAELLVALVGSWNPLWLLSGFFILTVLLTQPMSNQAAAAVVIPVALTLAVQLDLNPRTFAIMIAVAASTSYLTPLEPACLIVYGPGHYRFIDFLKVGGLLTLIIFGIAIALIPRIWPL